MNNITRYLVESKAKSQSAVWAILEWEHVETCETMDEAMKFYEELKAEDENDNMEFIYRISEVKVVFES
jgi:hypothetical protein